MAIAYFRVAMWLNLYSLGFEVQPLRGCFRLLLRVIRVEAFQAFWTPFPADNFQLFDSSCVLSQSSTSGSHIDFCCWRYISRKFSQSAGVLNLVLYRFA